MINKAYLVMALLWARHHPAVVPGAVVDGDVVTPGVPHPAARGLLHVLGGAGGLLVLPALLLPLLRLLARPHQGVVAVNQGLIVGNLGVRCFPFDHIYKVRPQYLCVCD